MTKCVHKLFVFLLDAPVFIKKPKDVHAYSDSNALFECLADGIPKPNTTWRRNGDMLENSDFNTIGYGFLLVKMLVLSDMGPYQCFAENSLGKVQATAELAVYMKGKYCQSKLKLQLVMGTMAATVHRYPTKPYRSLGTGLVARPLLQHCL